MNFRIIAREELVRSGSDKWACQINPLAPRIIPARRSNSRQKRQILEFENRGSADPVQVHNELNCRNRSENGETQMVQPNGFQRFSRVPTHAKISPDDWRVLSPFS